MANLPRNILVKINEHCDRETRWNLQECIQWRPRYYAPLQISAEQQDRLEYIVWLKSRMGPMHPAYTPAGVQRRRYLYAWACTAGLISCIYGPASIFGISVKRVFPQLWKRITIATVTSILIESFCGWIKMIEFLGPFYENRLEKSYGTLAYVKGKLFLFDYRYIRNRNYSIYQ